LVLDHCTETLSLREGMVLRLLFLTTQIPEKSICLTAASGHHDVAGEAKYWLKYVPYLLTKR